jgi:hypothetical protein
MLQYTVPPKAGDNRWAKAEDKVSEENYSYLTEPMTKPLKDPLWQSLKRLSFATLYGSAPKKLNWSPSLAAMISGDVSDGTPQRGQPSGKP